MEQQDARSKDNGACKVQGNKIPCFTKLACTDRSQNRGIVHGADINMWNVIAQDYEPYINSWYVTVQDYVLIITSWYVIAQD